MAKYQFELTDTFGGEANYAWVQRTVVDVPDSIGDDMLRMLAKKWAGFTGRRCTVEEYGDQQVIRPRGLCQVLFVTFEPDETDTRDALNGLVRWVENIGVEKNPMLVGIDKSPLYAARKALL